MARMGSVEYNTDIVRNVMDVDDICKSVVAFTCKVFKPYQ